MENLSSYFWSHIGKCKGKIENIDFIFFSKTESISHSHLNGIACKYFEQNGQWTGFTGFWAPDTQKFVCSFLFKNEKRVIHGSLSTIMLFSTIIHSNTGHTIRNSFLLFCSLLLDPMNMRNFKKRLKNFRGTGKNCWVY